MAEIVCLLAGRVNGDLQLPIADWRLPIGACGARSVPPGGSRLPLALADYQSVGVNTTRYGTGAVATRDIANFQLPIFDWLLVKDQLAIGNCQSARGRYRSRTVPSGLTRLIGNRQSPIEKLF